MLTRVFHSGVVGLTLLVLSASSQGFSQTHRWGGFGGPAASSSLPRYPRFGTAGAGFRAGPHSGFFFSQHFGSWRRNGFVFGNFSGRQNSFHPSSFFGGFAYPRGIFPSMTGSVPESSTTSGFVEEWKDRGPFSAHRSTSLPGSSLLSIGMLEDEIVRVLGSPIEKISTDSVVIWKYSSFSLRIENGKLAGLR
jgi:hypothetical protein